jgi:hypothetical protein
MKMSFTYTTTGVSTQGELSSSYTNALSSYLQNDGADLVAFLAYSVYELSVEAATALKADLASGNFSLSGLFSAAQSKEGAVDGDSIDNPTPMLNVGGVNIDLSAMLAGEATFTWDTATKKLVVSHTREFYTESKDPDGYSADWANPVQNQAPTAEAITWDVTEYDEHAAGADPTGAAKLVTVNLLDTQYVTDPDGDTLSVVADSVTLANGDPLPSYIVDNGDGTISVNTNSAEFDTLYKGDTMNIDLTYQITDSVNAPITNTVDLTITGTADLVSTSASTLITNPNLDGSFSIALVSPDGAFDYNYKGIATVTAEGDIDNNHTLDEKDEKVTVTFSAVDGGGVVVLGMLESDSTNQEPGETAYIASSDTDFTTYSSTDSTVTGTYDSNSSSGANGVDALVSIEVSVDYSYWI